MSLLEKKFLNFNNFIIFLCIFLSNDLVLSTSLPSCRKLESCFSLLSLFFFFGNRSVLVFFLRLRSLKPCLNNLLAILNALIWFLFHCFLSVLHFVVIHGIQEFRRRENAIEKMWDQVRNQFIRRKVSNVHVYDMLHASNKDFPFKEEFGLCHVFILDLISNITEITDVHSILMEEFAQGYWIRWNVFSLLKVHNQILNSRFLQIGGKCLYLILFRFDFFFAHCKLDFFEDIGIEYFPIEILNKALEVRLPLLIKFHN